MVTPRWLLTVRYCEGRFMLVPFRWLAFSALVPAVLFTTRPD
jgi:hypothetical protein